MLLQTCLRQTQHKFCIHCLLQHITHGLNNTFMQENINVFITEGKFYSGLKLQSGIFTQISILIFFSLKITEADDWENLY